MHHSAYSTILAARKWKRNSYHMLSTHSCFLILIRHGPYGVGVIWPMLSLTAVLYIFSVKKGGGGEIMLATRIRMSKEPQDVPWVTVNAALTFSENLENVRLTTVPQKHKIMMLIKTSRRCIYKTWVEKRWAPTLYKDCPWIYSCKEKGSCVVDLIFMWLTVIHNV